MKLSRRSLLGGGLAGLLGTPAMAGNRPTPARAKNVIFCVVDGMSLSSLTIADHMSMLATGKRSPWGWLMRQPWATNGLQDTRSLNSVVTDSSAASSSWGSGRRIWNGQVNMFPDGTELRTLTQILAEKSVRCGLVTTATITHATPAGFAVNCVQRDLEGLIAEKYLKANVDVLLGGGNRFFAPDKRADKKDLYADFRKAGFAVARNRSELGATTKSKKVLGIFSDGHIPYSVDWKHNQTLRSTVPTLAEMTRHALENLVGSPNGFLLQVEGARVDHGGHSVDLAAMVHDQIAFEEALRVIIDFARADGETLVVVTADHACGGAALNGAGDEYIESTGGLKTVAGMRSSYSPLFASMGSTPSVDHVRDVIKEGLGIELSRSEAGLVSESVAGRHAFGSSEFHSSRNATLAMVLGNHTKVTWTSGNHTSDHVLVTAFGPGSEQFGGLTQNVSFFDAILAVWEMKVSNPTMTFAEAAKHYEKLKAELTDDLFAEYAFPDEGCGCPDHAHLR